MLRIAVAFVILSSGAAGAGAATTAVPIPSDAELEARGALIGAIHFRIQNIFDLNDPRENKLLFRLANRLHIATRESAIRAQLLFNSGDRYSRRIINEAERAVRRSDYLFDAHIRPVAWDGTHVDLEVTTRDVWTLQPGLSFSRQGGKNSSEIEIQEENLFGRGKNITISRERDVERTSLLLNWRDPNIWGSRWRDEISYSSNDDGLLRALTLQRPFYSLDSRWSLGLKAFDDNRVDPRYDRGRIVDEFGHDQAFVELSGGWSRGQINGWTRRWLAGWRYDQNAFRTVADRRQPVTLPPDRRLSYPWVGIEWIEDHYEEAQNLNQIGRTEDLYLGTTLRLELGWAGTGLGADREAAVLAASASTAWAFNERRMLFLSGNASGRLESGDVVNGLLGGSARYYWRWQPQRVFYATLDASMTERLDPENQLLLGGDSDLRGYPLRYQTGISRALLTLEQRFYTDWYPFRLFYVGGAVFADVGRTWGRGPIGAGSLGLLKDIGIGLRLGNSRSGFGSVVHFDVAVPLDRDGDIDEVQFLVTTKQSF